MARLITLGDLHKHFEQARDKLAGDRTDILCAFPMPADFNRDEYGFTYVRAERIGLDVITETLDTIAWLPMQLDPKTEIMSENRTGMKRWLNAALGGQPDGTVFGNDFIHALTRAAMTRGWESTEFRDLSLRIGELFHDLSCLIGLIYYGVWMSENGIEGLPVTNPEDLERTAQEIATLTRSPEVALLLKRRRQNESDKVAPKPAVAAPIAAAPKRLKPVFHVIENTEWKGRSAPTGFQATLAGTD